MPRKAVSERGQSTDLLDKRGNSPIDHWERIVDAVNQLLAVRFKQHLGMREI
jgi:hypothetical protein